MTRTSSAKVAGGTFLVYIAAGLTSLAISRQATGGASAVADKLAAIALHPTHVGVVVLLAFVQAFSALTLGVTLWAITRDVDADIATFGMVCRVTEGVIAALSVATMPALLSLATASGADPAATQLLAKYLMRADMGVPATFFAVGSTAFCYLLLRGHIIPRPLAWIGFLGSLLLVVLLPLEMAGWVRGPVVMLIWLPMLVFELWVAVWFLTRGAVPASPTSAAA